MLDQDKTALQQIHWPPPPDMTEEEHEAEGIKDDDETLTCTI